MLRLRKTGTSTVKSYKYIAGEKEFEILCYTMYLRETGMSSVSKKSIIVFTSTQNRYEVVLVV